jgi:hypothetical protein
VRIAANEALMRRRRREGHGSQRYFRARSLLRQSMAQDSGKPVSLESPIVITEPDRKRLMLRRRGERGARRDNEYSGVLYR